MSLPRNASRGRIGLVALLVALVAGLAYVPGHADQPLSTGQKGVGPETIYGKNSVHTTPLRVQNFWDTKQIPAQPTNGQKGQAGILAQAKQASQVGAKAVVRPLANLNILPIFGTVFVGPNEVDANFFEPPDDVLAVGTGHIVVCVNTILGVYDKANPNGGPVAGFVPLDTTAGGFFEGLPDFGPLTFVSDPRCVYDEVHDRYIVTMLQGRDADSGTPPFPGNANLLIAASQTNDPTGAWFKYSIPFFGVKPDGKRTFGDQPTLGISRDFLYVSADDFPLDPADTSGFFQDNLKVLRLSQLYSGAGSLNVVTFGGINLTDAGGFQSFAMKPAVTHYGPNDPAGLPEFIVSPDPRPVLGFGTGNYLSIFSVTQGNVPALTKRLLPVKAFRNPNRAPQPGTPITINTNDSSRSMSNSVWRNNSLWCAHSVRGDNGEASVVRWYEISAASINSISLRQTGTTGGVGDAYFPAVEVNRAGTTVIGFSTSNSATFPSAAAVTRSPIDPPNTVRATGIYQPGEAAYTGGRWGDYSGAATDPVDDSIWVINEYAQSQDPITLNVPWGTSIAQVTLESFSISGNVLDEFGAPLAGAQVRLSALVDASATHFNTSTFNIPDFSNVGVLSPIAFPETGNVIQGAVTVDVNHQNPSELQFFLVAPTDPARPGQTIFPLAGTWPNLSIPVDPNTGLQTIAGRKVNGQWLLQVKDTFRGNVGSLTSWSLTLDYEFPFNVTPQTTGAAGAFNFAGLVPGGRYRITPSVGGLTFTPPSTDVVLNGDVTGLVFQADFVVLPDIESLVIDPSSVQGGGVATGRVTLTEAAPGPGGLVVLLDTDDASLNLPASVTIPAGQRTATFQIGTHTVDADSTATITATREAGGGTPQQATLTILTGNIVLFRIDPTSVAGGDSAGGIITLNSPAPVGGISINLQSSSSAIIVPTAVVVPEGATSVGFTVNTRTVSSPVAGSVVASLGSIQQTATFTVLPASLGSVLVSPDPVRGSLFSRARIRLRRPAPGSGAQITLRSSNGNVAWFKQRGLGTIVVTIPPGQVETTVIIGTNPVPRNTTVAIRASQGSVTVSDTLTVTR